MAEENIMETAQKFVLGFGVFILTGVVVVVGVKAAIELGTLFINFI